jgi:hypothetical protein
VLCIVCEYGLAPDCMQAFISEQDTMLSSVSEQILLKVSVKY